MAVDRYGGDPVCYCKGSECCVSHGWYAVSCSEEQVEVAGGRNVTERSTLDYLLTYNLTWNLRNAISGECASRSAPCQSYFPQNELHLHCIESEQSVPWWRAVDKEWYLGIYQKSLSVDVTNLDPLILSSVILLLTLTYRLTCSQLKAASWFLVRALLIHNS